MFGVLDCPCSRLEDQEAHDEESHGSHQQIVHASLFWQMVGLCSACPFAAHADAQGDSSNAESACYPGFRDLDFQCLLLETSEKKAEEMRNADVSQVLGSDI